MVAARGVRGQRNFAFRRFGGRYYVGRELDLRGIHMRLLGGRFDGQAHSDLDRLKTSTAEFTWEKLDFKKLALIFPQLKEFSGELTGGLRIAPTVEPHPLDVLEVEPRSRTRPRSSSPEMSPIVPRSAGVRWGELIGA